MEASSVFFADFFSLLKKLFLSMKAPKFIQEDLQISKALRFNMMTYL